MAQLIRRLVSQDKKRFRDAEFDLDLSYVTPKIIAMSWPAPSPAEGLYRNPFSDVVRMLNKYHGGAYKVYNLCRERTYDPGRFVGGDFAWYPFADHHVPPMPLLVDFVKDAAEYLAAARDNVVVVHCKAGKGRTGICIASLLLHLGEARTWTAALAQFAIARMSNAAGVTIASQRRWVQYYDIARHTPEFLDTKRTEASTAAAIQLTLIAVKNLPAKLAARIHVVVEGRSLCTESGQYKEECLIEAFMPPVASSWSSSAVAKLCGTNGVRAGALALTGASTGSVEVGPQLTPFGRVHIGCGWRMMQTGPKSVAVIFEEEASWRLAGEFKIQVFVDAPSKRSSLFWAWHNSAFMAGTSCTLSRESLDKVASGVPADVELCLGWLHAGRTQSQDTIVDAPTSTLPSVPPQLPVPSPASLSVAFDLERDTWPSGIDEIIEFSDTLPEPPEVDSSFSISRRILTAGSSPLAAWFRGGGGAHTAPPVDATPDSERRAKAQTVDLSLLDRLDGAWMGSCSRAPVQTDDVTEQMQLSPRPALVPGPLHETSAFIDCGRRSEAACLVPPPFRQRRGGPTGLTSRRSCPLATLDCCVDAAAFAEAASAGPGGGASGLSGTISIVGGQDGACSLSVQSEHSASYLASHASASAASSGAPQGHPAAAQSQPHAPVPAVMAALGSKHRRDALTVPAPSPLRPLEMLLSTSGRENIDPEPSISLPMPMLPSLCLDRWPAAAIGSARSGGGVDCTVYQKRRRRTQQAPPTASRCGKRRELHCRAALDDGLWPEAISSASELSGPSGGSSMHELAELVPELAALNIAGHTSLGIGKTCRALVSPRALATPRLRARRLVPPSATRPAPLPPSRPCPPRPGNLVLEHPSCGDAAGTSPSRGDLGSLFVRAMACGGPNPHTGFDPLQASLI